ncbi:MAG TPA: S1C family serine protease, partial [Candidatus Nitrosocosmicus sp.]|nr:S1C family serine protease [Candidatus Nitrosocosmicus sp.]
MKFKAAYALLIGSFIILLSVYIFTSNTPYIHFIQLLLPINATAQSQPTLPSQSASSRSLPSTAPSSLPDVFQKVENSVVQITSTKSNPNEVIILNGVPQTGRSTALGSGFVYDNQGHIVTNYHVVSGVKKADVTFTDGNTYSANVVGKDPNSDLGILQITGNYSSEEKGVVPLPLANSSAVRPGEQVIAIGNPFGLSGTITTGIVSQ